MIGIIGGSGLEDTQILQDVKEENIETPYGIHSPIKVGTINGIEVALMTRHGYRHEYAPTTVPYKANIYALQKIGVKVIIAASACGSLRDDIAPGTFSFPSQVIDRTTKRDQSYSAHGNVVHESMAQPFSQDLRSILIKASKKMNFKFTSDTTLITIEGPRFSTRAESELFRSWNCDLINMTTIPECFLAKELHIPYQVINMVTDYDCWHQEKQPVTYEEVLKIMKLNAVRVKQLIIEVLPAVNEKFK